MDRTEIKQLCKDNDFIKRMWDSFLKKEPIFSYKDHQKNIIDIYENAHFNGKLQEGAIEYQAYTINGLKKFKFNYKED